MMMAMLPPVRSGDHAALAVGTIVVATQFIGAIQHIIAL